MPPMIDGCQVRNLVVNPTNCVQVFVCLFVYKVGSTTNVGLELMTLKSRVTHSTD